MRLVATDVLIPARHNVRFNSTAAGETNDFKTSNDPGPVIAECLGFLSGAWRFGTILYP